MLNRLTISQWRGLPTDRRSASALVDDTLAAIHANRDLNAFLHVDEDRARHLANIADKQIAVGDPGRLVGVPIAVKDNFCTRGIETTAGSRMLKGFVPPYESFVTKRLLDEGAIFIGKTNMDEFGMGSSTENSAFMRTMNPRAVELGLNDYSAGGSSGGSAAAVAADLCLAALGTDTGGSIRQPASFCGVVGFKPTYGTCSRWGIIAYASSLDQAGVITKSVNDAAILMDIIAAEDPGDSTSVDYEFDGFEKGLAEHTGTFTVGIPRQFREFDAGSKQNLELDGLYRELERRVHSAGGRIKTIELPTIAKALPTYYIIALAEASSNLARYDGVRYGMRAPNPRNMDDLYETTRNQGFNHETINRVMLGTYCLSAGYYDQYYTLAQKVRMKISLELRAAFDEIDFLGWPTTPTPAFQFGSHSIDPKTMYLEDVFTVPVNLAGLPAISLPIYRSSNALPMGAQLIGRQFDDERLLATANRLLGA